MIFSFSARKRDINKRHIGISAFLKILKKTKSKKIGLMFGPEASGLSNIDLSYANYVVQIPTSTNLKSLNLSHSLSLICYEIFKLNNFKIMKQSSFFKKIGNKGKMTAILKLLKKNLDKKNFFKPLEKKNSMLTNINNLFYRFEPNDKELRILGSLIGTLGKNKKKHN
jgi:tRNA/rRNA methyltransferase